MRVLPHLPACPQVGSTFNARARATWAAALPGVGGSRMRALFDGSDPALRLEPSHKNWLLVLDMAALRQTATAVMQGHPPPMPRQPSAPPTPSFFPAAFSTPGAAAAPAPPPPRPVPRTAQPTAPLLATHPMLYPSPVPPPAAAPPPPAAFNQGAPFMPLAVAPPGPRRPSPFPPALHAMPAFQAASAAASMAASAALRAPPAPSPPAQPAGAQRGWASNSNGKVVGMPQWHARYVHCLGADRHTLIATVAIKAWEQLCMHTLITTGTIETQGAALYAYPDHYWYH